MESHGRINFGPHSSSLSPAGSSGRFESVIKGYSRTLCQIMEAGKRAPHTQTPPRSATGQVPAFHLAALPRVRRWSQWSRLYGVWVPGAAQPSRWLLRTIWLGYAIQFTRRPPKFRGSRCPCLVRVITVLLAKDVMVPVPPADMKAGFFSPYIIVPKKSGGLRPILGLRILNWAFHKPTFKMLMQNRVFGCIRPQVRSAAFDLKDPYFHVSILPCHRPFLRFAFEGRAYQYRSCPSGCPYRPVSSRK